MPQKLKGKFMKKISESQRKELEALAAKSENEIDFSDAPATTEGDWKSAVRGKFFRPVKHQLTVRIDADVLDWLKSDGKGYQSRLNDILRKAMLNNHR
ncbi:MAG: BrnA antitoxin family protein [Burkholderiaceae bacterium]